VADEAQRDDAARPRPTGAEPFALTHVGATPQPRHVPRKAYDAPYRLFLGSSLTLAIFGGFLLAVLLPLADALEWPWGRRWNALVQAHGQLQLLGFAGLFVFGMALRLMPRFSGREVRYPVLVRILIPAVAGGVILRALAQPFAGDGVRNAGLVLSSALLVVGALAFATVICGTILQRESRAEATKWFFALGSAAYVAAGALDAVIVFGMVRHGRDLAPHAENEALIFLQLFGFVLLFLCGVATRAVPSLTGHPRPERGSRVAASLLAAGVAAYVAAALWAAYDAPTRTTARAQDVALLVVAAAFVLVTWLTGVARPRANRVARASQTYFHFVQAAFAWLLVVAALIAWYAAHGLRDGKQLDVYEVDAVRHALTVGVVTMMIVGMGMLVVPEFAGRRLQHPHEEPVAWLVLIALNVAVVLRIWPPLEGIDWIAMTRFWPMFAAGAFAIAAVGTFAFMFGQSWVEQRHPGWGSAEALRARFAKKRA